MNHQVFAGDSAECLSGMPSGFVDLVVTSPPYDKLRTYSGKLEWDFERTAKHLFRVLRPGGVLCWNVADQTKNGCESLTSAKQKIYFVEVAGFRLHDTMIYEKTNFSHPERTRYHNVFEYVFILSKGKPKTFNPIMDKKNATAGCMGNLGVNTFTEVDGTKSVRKKQLTKEFGMRHNVWRGLTRGQEDMCKVLPRTAMMPRWLARDLIRSWSNTGDMVLDPFGGSGTTVIEALKLQRTAFAIDNDPSAIALIEQSITKMFNA